MLDIRNIREDQILVWNASLARQLADGKSIALGKHLNFAEALYLPSQLDRIIAEARRDQQEFGFAQLRLVACFLSWTNLKETPSERFVSPLVLIPVQLKKTKGVRDTYSLEALSSEAELNPVVRHQFQELYNIELPETIDLARTDLDALFDYLAGKVHASEPGVTLSKIDRPRIDLVHEKARRRLDQYRRSARVSGRGVRSFLDLDYSYDLANYHPLGIKLFSALIRTPTTQLREIVEQQPRPRTFAAPPDHEAVFEKERTFYQVRDATEENAFLWNYDLCSLTLANLRYRRMSLVRDYEAILERSLTNPALEAAFSLTPRPLGRELPPVPALEQRYDVVPCDPTQATAIAEARRGASYIIQGPPGTGKSQTITNLIADYVARGLRVLFVCEKRAAIDVVFARLRQCGLGPLCSLIHDSQTDKKAFILDLKQTYESLAEDDSASGVESRAKLLSRLQHSLAPLTYFEQAMEQDAPLAAMPLRQFLERCIALRACRPELTPDQAERLPTYSDWWPHREQLDSLDSSLRELEPCGVLARHPLRRLRPDLNACERPLEVVRKALEGANQSLARLLKCIGQSGIPADRWHSLANTGALLAHLQLLAPLARQGNLALADSASQRSQRFKHVLAQLREVDDRLAAARKATTKWREKLPLDEVAAALVQARGFEKSYFAWLSPSWWRLRSILGRAYDFRAHAVRPSWADVLAALHHEQVIVAERARFVDQARAHFGGQLGPDELQRAIEDLHQRTPQLPEWLRGIQAELIKSPQADEIVSLSVAAEQPYRDCRTALDAAVVDYDQLPFVALEGELSAIRGGLAQLPLALAVLSDLQATPVGIGQTLREFPWDLSQAEAAIAQHTWDRISLGDRELGRFDGRKREQHIQHLEALYDEWLAANAREACQNVRDRFREHLRLTNLAASQLTAEQKEFKKGYLQGRRTLEHEFGKTMRYKSIRELVDGEAGQVIRDLKPVWLMSPLSVSDTLPLAMDFVDVVIFDEASQVPLEESVPSLIRGKQVIIVGDEMQLPPTNFFSIRQPGEEDSELPAEEAGERFEVELSSDSLLNHAGKNLPSTMLGWHYRSRSESLISFSNWAFYDGRLLTVPEHRRLEAATSERGEQAPVPPIELLLSRPVSFHHLPDGLYDRRRNRAEAEYIARLVAELLKRGEGLSLGVIAFSEAQQTEIESALDRLAADDDEFRRLYEEELQREADGQFVGLLVKNLENIQGDERDVIILSICYGRGPSGKMLMNFGPINQSGGEKRLNVAFSRAKQHMAVVSTIRYAEITNEYNVGANCLRNYLRYTEAMSGGDLHSAQRVLGGITRWKDHGIGPDQPPPDAVAQQLAAELRRNGFTVDLGIGQSHFRVDLAVRRPGDSGYRLGILIDTLMQYQQAEPLERDVMRPRLLENFGWRIESVLAKDWYERPEDELRRLLEVLATAGQSASGHNESREAPANVENHGEPTKATL